MAIRYVDMVNGLDTNGGTSWADAWKTLKVASWTANDEIRVAKSPDPMDLGVTATLAHQTRTITLSSSLTQLISECETAWTAANSCTTATNASYKSGTASTSITTKSTSWGGGLCAYFATGTLNLSAYQQVSFWIMNNTSATVNAGDIKIKLFSDAAGATEVASLDLPALPAVARWTPVTLNYGSALPSTVQSIGLYVGSAPGSAKNFLLDNINACKAPGGPCLTHNCVIGRNPAATNNTDGWWAIRSISGTSVVVENLPSESGATASRGIINDSGTTDNNVPLYMRQLISAGTPALAQGTVTYAPTVSGWSLLGGWNTSTGLQDGETWINGFNGFGYWLSMSNAITAAKMADHFGFVRFYGALVLANASNSGTVIGDNSFAANYYGIYNSVANITTITIGKVIGNGGTNLIYGASSGAYNWTIDSIYARSFGTSALTTSALNMPWTINYVQTYNNGSHGMDIGGYATINSGVFKWNAQYGLSDNSGCGGKYYNLVFSNNTSGSFLQVAGGSGKWTYFYNCLFGDATEVNMGSNTYTGNNVYSHNHDQTDGNHWIFSDLGNYINSQTATRHTASGLAWKFTVGHAGRNFNNPLILSVGKILCQANTPVTVTLWMQKSNANCGVALKVKGGQIAGVPNDVISTMSDTLNTWEQETVTFTPTATGVVEITAIAWAKNSTGLPFYAYIDDLGVS